MIFIFLVIVFHTVTIWLTKMGSKDRQVPRILSYMVRKPTNNGDENEDEQRHRKSRKMHWNQIAHKFDLFALVTYTILSIGTPFVLFLIIPNM